MSSEIGWEFPSNGGGAAEGHNNGAVDTFAGQRLSAMVREVIQNSLDAKPEGSNLPVKLAFSLHELSSGDIDGFDELSNHIGACEKMAKEQELAHVEAVYRKSKESLRSDKPLPVLVISDYNTTGLVGPLDKQKGAWFALTKGTGITQKQNASSLGSFGHGSKAPFLMADARTLFYLTKIELEGGDQLRFQGKSILLSHEHPGRSNVTTQATGFFGFKEGLRPLLDDAVPSWATALREKDTDDYGTSIIIPYTSFDKGLFPETKITVVANFFYAIKDGRLEVVIDNEVINKDNIVEKFNWCVANLENEQDEIDVEHIEGCFKSIQTIIEPTYFGSEELRNFGRVDWYLRLNDDVDYKSVAIARESGMLITRRPPQLQRFPGIKQFDMFVFIHPGDGSAALKRLENPEHTNFEFGRVANAVDEKGVQAAYKSLVKEIRAVLSNHAASETSEEEDVSDLAKYLFSAAAEGPDDGANERGTQIKIQKGKRKPKRRHVQPGTGRLVPGGGGTGGRNPKQPGGGGGDGARPTDPGGSSGPGGNDDEVPAEFQLENLRAVPLGARGVAREVKLFFDMYEEGEFDISIRRGSDTAETKAVELVIDGKKASSKRVSILVPGRNSVMLELANPEDANFALEGWVNEVSQ